MKPQPNKAICVKVIPPHPGSCRDEATVAARGNVVPGRLRRAAGLGLGAVAGLCLALWTSLAGAASFQETNGFVVMEAEDFDLNVTQDAGQWVFDAAALAVDPYSGWGYLKAVGAGGTSPSFSARADFKVNFTNTGPHYIWVSGSEEGGDSVHVGLDGLVTSTSLNIGDNFGFGAGELWWVGLNNLGSGYYAQPYLDVTTTGEHTVNLFIREERMAVDRFLLTTNSAFEPSPAAGGTNSGANVPAPTLAPVASLAAAITQPATGKSFSSNSVVTVAAKAFTNGPAVTKMEFFAKLLPSGADTKIGERTARPYQIGWTNPAVGNYALKAKVTDSSTATATSAVVNVSIFVPSTCPKPLVWTSNNFGASLGSFSLTVSNHAPSPGYPQYAFDLDWSNTSNAGGPAGELGGRVIRTTVAPYVAAPLAQALSRNDHLWFRCNMAYSDLGSANSDVFFGYFDTNTFARVGFKVNNPSGSSGGWRFRTEPDGNRPYLHEAFPGCVIPNGQAATVEFHWIPSGLGDGSGTVTGTVANVAFTKTWTNTTAATFNAFGLFVPAQGADEPNLEFNAWFDTVQYKVWGVIGLTLQRMGANQLVLSWTADGYTLQSNDSSIANAGGWATSPDPVVLVGGTYYSTNTISSGTRFFRLKGNCP